MRLSAVPLLAIPVLLANLVAFMGDEGIDATLLGLTLPSGATVTITTGVGLILLGLVLMYLEIFKSTRTGQASIVDHVLSMLVFVVALIEFVTVPRLGNAMFLTLLLMTLIDVIAGFTVTISSARRDFGTPG
jgi:steroid 5-alpha reductase family enzyme